MTDITAKIAEGCLLLEYCRHWSSEMHRAARSIEDEGFGTVYELSAAASNRAIGDTLAAAEKQIAALLDVAEAAAGVVEMPLDCMAPLRGALAAYARAGGAS